MGPAYHQFVVVMVMVVVVVVVVVVVIEPCPWTAAPQEKAFLADKK